MLELAHGPIFRWPRDCESCHSNVINVVHDTRNHVPLPKGDAENDATPTPSICLSSSSCRTRLCRLTLRRLNGRTVHRTGCGICDCVCTGTVYMNAPYQWAPCRCGERACLGCVSCAAADSEYFRNCNGHCNPADPVVLLRDSTGQPRKRRSHIHAATHSSGSDGRTHARTHAHTHGCEDLDPTCSSKDKPMERNMHTGLSGWWYSCQCPMFKSNRRRRLQHRRLFAMHHATHEGQPQVRGDGGKTVSHSHTHKHTHTHTHSEGTTCRPPHCVSAWICWERSPQARE